MRINLNGKWLETAKEILSYEDIVGMVCGDRNSPHAYSVVYRAKSNGDRYRAGTLWLGKSVEVEDGMVITAMITDNA